MTIVPAQRICPRCRAANAAEATVCRGCGVNINQSLAVSRLGGLTLPVITRREVGATAAVAATALALRLARRVVRVWLARPGASAAVTSITQEAKPPAITVVRKTWWHVSRSDGASEWGSQQDTWEIEAPPAQTGRET